MKRILMYIANDGEQFDNEKDCILHEREIKAKEHEINNLMRAAKRIKEICLQSQCKSNRCFECPIYQQSYTNGAKDCPFAFGDYTEGISPFDWRFE